MVKKIIENTEAASQRHLYRGVVVSDKMEQTVVVQVEITYQHPQFGKTLRRRKRYKVHDAQEIANVGDVIEFFSGRPVSKTKYMHLAKIVSEAAQQY
jgi:small subunit ribosomal protein S17